MKFLDDVDFVVDEKIWGHRLYDEQLPHLIILEFLGILVGNCEQPLKEEGGKVIYKPQRQLRLRGILFNNPYINMIASSTNKSDEKKWEEWFEEYQKGAYAEEDMSYLKDVFKSFDDFARVVELLRSSSFEVNSNKRWSSKFVFPFGPDALYEDLRVDKAETNDRRFFARTGEILYLMLCRSYNKEELGEFLVKRLLCAKMPLNRLVKAIQGEKQDAKLVKEISSQQLPVNSHKRFDQLCQDWIHILKQDIPAYDVISYLMFSAGLNMLLYFLERSKEVLKDEVPVRMVCEIISKQRTKIRTISADDYQFNQNLSLRSIGTLIENIQQEDEWLSASKEADPEVKYIQLMQKHFKWPSSEEENSNWTAETFIQKLINKAETRHKQHLARVHSAWSKAIGLSSRRLSRRMRYAPNDYFLKSLVITVVDKRMPFDDFLEIIKSRYGLIIGEAQAEELIASNQVDQEALSKNSEFLAERLMSLGLVRQLSDGCAFVENPFSIEGNVYASK
ncbi:hypothetical protein [Acinetobacter sp. 3657]|uniref:hypothetical protein n=1 Tax=Acinetobacter sp. 3657 TaxID=2817764 RepID=UPI00285A08C5|nr:hypothetical protein [Prolinoborus sp. 3657]